MTQNYFLVLSFGILGAFISGVVRSWFSRLGYCTWRFCWCLVVYSKGHLHLWSIYSFGSFSFQSLLPSLGVPSNDSSLLSGIGFAVSGIMQFWCCFISTSGPRNLPFWWSGSWGMKSRWGEETSWSCYEYFGIGRSTNEMLTSLAGENAIIPKNKMVQYIHDIPGGMSMDALWQRARMSVWTVMYCSLFSDRACHSLQMAKSIENEGSYQTKMSSNRIYLHRIYQRKSGILLHTWCKGLPLACFSCSAGGSSSPHLTRVQRE